MEKIVYILGAGFSAPLGLPVVSNFRFKSQDIYLTDRAKYAHFEEVFDMLSMLSSSKNFYQTDLYNIEEILSILEMTEYLEGRRLKPVFIRYIKDVIAFSTPEILNYGGVGLPNNWEVAVFGQSGSAWQQYGYFIGALLNLQFAMNNVRQLDCSVNQSPAARYAIVTLNYDLIPEMVWDYCRRTYNTSASLEPFTTATAGTSPGNIPSNNMFSSSSVYVCKLHGSVDGTIVPPTWSKGAEQSIVPAWKMAHDLLKEATQIRILGFSLPVADSYVKYLLKSAAIQNRFLKKIDVICLDPDKSARRRFDDFVQFSAYRFVSANIFEYLSVHASRYSGAAQSIGNRDLGLDKLESLHDSFMRDHWRPNQD